MNKAPVKVKFSLRKLLIATLAIGPLAILPSPVWATLPTYVAGNSTGNSFTVTNGAVSLTTLGGTANIVASDRAVLVWGFQNATSSAQTTGQFAIGAGQIYQFSLPSSTSTVLNKVGYAPGGSLSGTDTATISGELDSNGKVFILANGGINVNNGAVITTAGTVLSTLQESNDFNFTQQGNLTFAGASTGTIAISEAAAASVNVTNGTLSAYAGVITLNNITVQGDLLINQTTANTVFTANSVTTGGNLTVITNNGAIGNATGLWIAANGTSTFNTTGGGGIGNVAIVLSNLSNDFKTISVTTGGAATSGGNVTINDANIITLAASTVGSDLGVTVTATGNTGNTSISTNGAVVVGGNATFTQSSVDNAGISIGNSSSVGGLLNATTANSSITFNGVGAINLGTITAGTGNKSSVSITTNGILSIGNNITAVGNSANSGGSISLAGANIVQTQTIGGIGAISSTGGGTVSFNASVGDIKTGNITGNTVSLNASAGSINPGGVQPAGTVITTGNATGTSAFRTASTGSVDLSGSNSFAGGQVITFNGGTATITNVAAGATVLGTTNATGNVKLTSTTGSIQLGNGAGTSAQNITVGGTLTALATAATGSISDNAYSAFNVFGAVNLTTGGGAITMNAARQNGGLAPLVQFGAVTANTTGAVGGTVLLAETNTLNIASINATTATLAAVTGNIIQSGAIKTTTSTSTQVSAAGSVTLNNSANQFTALTLNGGTDASVTDGLSTTVLLNAGSSVPANVTLTTTGATDASLNSGTFANLTVNAGNRILTAGAISGNNITLNSTAALNPTSTISASNLTLTSAGAMTIGAILSAGNLVVNGSGSGITESASSGFTVTGNATINSAGTAILNQTNDFATVTLNVTGAATVNDNNNLTVNGTVGGALSTTAGFAGAGAVAAPWSLTLGNLSVNSLAAVAANGGSGNSGTLTQASGATLHSENAATFTTASGNIVVANVGNSAGRVTLSTGGNNNTVTYAEDGTVKLGNLNNGNGTVTITARNGSIVEDSTGNNRYTNNGTLSLQAVNGSILIGGNTNTGFTTDGALTSGGGGVIANAPGGAVVLTSNTANLTINSVNANSFQLAASGNVSQTNAMSVFGSANITAGGNLTLGNTSNNFGPVLVNETGTNKNVSVTESGTLNLRTVSFVGGGNGTFTANSVNGDVISTGFGGVRPGGNTTATGTGVVTLTALKGNITVGDATTDFPTTGGVVFNGNNVSLTVLGSNNSTLILGAATGTSVAGNLTVTTAIGSIGNNGNIVVSGNAVVNTGNGNIVMNQAGNQFGQLRFTGNQVSITQSNDMKIQTNSSAIGVANLTSGGNITIVNTGGSPVSFGSTVALNATGTIILPKLMQAANTLTVNASGTIDLSALSQSGDLGGKSPLHPGPGAYTGPSN